MKTHKIYQLNVTSRARLLTGMISFMRYHVDIDIDEIPSPSLYGRSCNVLGVTSQDRFVTIAISLTIYWLLSWRTQSLGNVTDQAFEVSQTILASISLGLNID